MFQALAVQMGVAWGLGMLNRAMAGRPPRPPKPRPDDIDFPLTRVGTLVPIVFGTMKIDSPLLVWADLFKAIAEPGYPGTFRYSASCLFVLGTPPQQNLSGTGAPQFRDPFLRRIWIGDKQVDMPGLSLTHGNSVPKTVDFGQEGGGGWFKGYVEFFDGRADQLITTYPSTDPTLMKRVDKAFAASALVDRSLVPGYENQILLALLADTYTVGSDATFGEQAQFPSVAAEVTCTDTLSNDANPAMVLYDLICGEVWKLGYDPALVGLASFQTAAVTLISEGNLCSGKIDAEEDIENVCNALLAQMDGVLDVDPSTGLIELRLIRGGYTLGSLREMNVDNTVGRPRVTQTGWLENANYVEVKFTNRDKQYQPDFVPSKRLSNAVNQGYRSRPRTVDYPYCMTATLAGKLAARDAAVLCRPIMTAQATLDRSFYDLRRGIAVRANWPQINVVDKAFRVLDIDRGQLKDDLVRVTLVEDVFDQTAGAIDPGDGVVVGVDDLPVLHRVLDEAPRWLVQLAYSQGLIPNATSSRALAVGRAEPEQPLAASYAMQSRLTSAPDYTTDVIPQVFATTARVATAYPYHLEPYDTTTGLVIESVTGELATTFDPQPLSPYSPGDPIPPLAATAGQIAGGANLIRIGSEMLAYESVTYLGGGQFRLNNVWRGLHDTTADDHAAGDVVYWLDFDNVGTRAWTAGDVIEGQPITVPVELGNFDPPTDELTISSAPLSLTKTRIDLPYKGADLNATAAELVRGTAGLPAVPGYLKHIDDYDGALDLVWRQRSETAPSVVRGDDATSYSVQSNATWSVRAQKAGQASVSIQSGLAEASVSSAGVLLGKAGHGAIDVLLRTNARINILGVDHAAGSSWQDARVRVNAHRARNLLRNGFALELGTAGWSLSSGATIARNVGGGGVGDLGYFETTAVPIDVTTAYIEQTVDVTGYRANGLRARVVWYTKNKNADANDYSGVVITSGATSSTSANVIGPTNVWQRAEHSITIPPGATSVTVRVRMNGVSNMASNAMVTGISLHVEQASDELISNGSFTDGIFTDWTNVTNSFAANTSDEYASDDGTKRCAQAGSFAESEIKQEVAIPAGYEYGDAVLELARSGIDIGEAILEVLNGGGSVIASATTGEEGMLAWTRRRVIVALPDGAATLRVRLRAEIGGMVPVDALFDDVSLRIHKDLDASYERALDFSAPAYQVAPRTWQESYLAWPALAIPAVFDGSNLLPSVRQSQRNLAATAAWSDASTPTPAKFVGYWQLDDDPALSIDAYRFARAAAGSAVDVQVDGYGEFAKTDSFSVAVLFRVTERALTSACGLVGRRDPTDKGWGLQLDAAGRVVAAAKGTTERTATGTIDHRDGAPHWVLMTWNGSTLRVVDASGSATNLGDPGEFAITSYPLRIGRDGASSETGGVDIARVLLWDSEISAVDFLDTIHRIGTDPNGRIDRNAGWTSSLPVWLDAGSDFEGALLVRAATRHIPIGVRDGEYGVSIGASQSNLVLSTDYAGGSHCGPEANVTATHGITDPTGLTRGVRTNSTVAGFGYRLTDIPLGASSGTVSVVLWMRTLAVAQDVVVRLLDSNDITSDSATISLDQTWQRFELALAWSGATPTGHLKLAVEGATGTFDLASVVHVGFGLPTAYTDANTSVGDRHGVVTETLPLHLHREGEIEVRCVATAPLHGSYVASVDNNTIDLKNKRAIAISAGSLRTMLHDNAGAPTTTDAANDWDALHTVACRWNTLGLPEAGAQLGARVDDATLSSTSPASFTVSTSVPSEKIRIGGGDLNGSTSPHALLSRIVVRSREEKLP